uniref:Uncharacterized protein n=1 Tax=Oryza glumipatula TaxID=40148 RepID=A0A0E0B0E4_9ORYZ
MQQFNSGGGPTLWSRSGGVQATGGVEEAVTTASGCGGAAAGDGDSPRQWRGSDEKKKEQWVYERYEICNQQKVMVAGKLENGLSHLTFRRANFGSLERAVWEESGSYPLE